MRITLDQVETLDAIERSGSFAAAARSLGRVPSAVTYTIRTLEQALGIALFDRRGHRARLTSSGRRVLELSRRLLQEAAEVESLAAALREGWEPRLALVVDGLLPLAPILEALGSLAGERPPTRVRLMVEYLGGVRERFEAERAELMLDLEYRGEDTWSATPLPPVEMRLVARSDHPLVTRGRTVTRRELVEEVELSVADSSRAAGSRAHRLFFGGPQVYFFSDFHAKLEALRRGLGFGWMPEHLVRPLLEGGELATVAFEEGGRFAFHPHLVLSSARPGRATAFLAAALERAFAPAKT
ncbi:MAG: LysR family transcriptional regulator [Acidobacteriota bacterium]|nr:LysR family transcriptional regulator [Acidobacteriota bacterium]MDQ7086577.1 LysR family transcriptional regulator [Acidobacteriota bacterium]